MLPGPSAAQHQHHLCTKASNQGRASVSITHLPLGPYLGWILLKITAICFYLGFLCLAVSQSLSRQRVLPKEGIQDPLKVLACSQFTTFLLPAVNPAAVKQVLRG